MVYRKKSLGLTLMSPFNLLQHKLCCFLISALNSWNLDLSILLPVFLFCFCASFIPFSNLPSNLRCNRRDVSYRSTCLKRTIFIYSLLYEGSYQIGDFLNRTRTRMTIEMFILFKIWRTSPHGVTVTLLIQINFTPWFLSWGNKLTCAHSFDRNWHVPLNQRKGENGRRKTLWKKNKKKNKQKNKQNKQTKNQLELRAKCISGQRQYPLENPGC